MDITSAVMQFDTLDYAKKLETAGVPNAQAEAQAKALGEVLGKAVAFPGDLVTLENNLTSKIAAVESRLDARMTAVESRLEARMTSLDTRIDTVRNDLETRIDTAKNELKLDLGGRIETLKWMFGVLVALNVGILIRLLAIH